jgi:hypothetical protein
MAALAQEKKAERWRETGCSASPPALLPFSLLPPTCLLQAFSFPNILRLNAMAQEQGQPHTILAHLIIFSLFAFANIVRQGEKHFDLPLSNLK